MEFYGWERSFSNYYTIHLSYTKHLIWTRWFSPDLRIFNLARNAFDLLNYILKNSHWREKNTFLAIIVSQTNDIITNSLFTAIAVIE